MNGVWVKKQRLGWWVRLLFETSNLFVRDGCLDQQLSWNNNSTWRKEKTITQVKLYKRWDQFLIVLLPLESSRCIFSKMGYKVQLYSILQSLSSFSLYFCIRSLYMGDLSQFIALLLQSLSPTCRVDDHSSRILISSLFSLPLSCVEQVISCLDTVQVTFSH